MKKEEAEKEMLDFMTGNGRELDESMEYFRKRFAEFKVEESDSRS